MAGRNRVPRHPMHDRLQSFRDGPPPPFSRGSGLVPLHVIEEERAIRSAEMRRMLADQQLMIEENVARTRDLAAIREEIHALGPALPKLRAEKEAHRRELIQRGVKLEAELRALEPFKAEFEQLKSEAQKLDVECQGLSSKRQSISQDLKHLHAENQQIPAMKGEIDGLRKEMMAARNACEFEKRAHAELIEQRQAMENNLITMAREIEKLKADHRNMEMRTGGPGAGAYGVLKGGLDAGYLGSYTDGYGVEKGPYGSGAPYDLHRR